MSRTAKLVGLLVALEAESAERAWATVMTAEDGPLQIAVTMAEARHLGRYFGQTVTLTGELPDEVEEAAELEPEELQQTVEEAQRDGDELGAALAMQRLVAGPKAPRTTMVRRLAKLGKLNGGRTL